MGSSSLSMMLQECRPLGMPGVPLAYQLTLSQLGGADYAHLITTGTPGFSDLPTALRGTCHLKIHLKIIEGFRKRKHNEVKILMGSDSIVCIQQFHDILNDMIYLKLLKDKSEMRFQSL